MSTRIGVGLPGPFFVSSGCGSLIGGFLGLLLLGGLLKIWPIVLTIIVVWFIGAVIVQLVRQRGETPTHDETPAPGSRRR